MAKVGKRLKTLAAEVDRAKTYSLPEAIRLVKQTARAKFDETVEMSMNLGIDPRHADVPSAKFDALLTPATPVTAPRRDAATVTIGDREVPVRAALLSMTLAKAAGHNPGGVTGTTRTAAPISNCALKRASAPPH